MEEQLNHYNKSEVIDRFEINKIFDSPLLHEWISVLPIQLKASHQDILEEARLDLSYKWGEWNEEELKMNFISVVLLVAQVKEAKRIGLYYERKFFGEVNSIPISLIVDCMLAAPSLSGQPKSPYFFLQEFQQSLGDGHDAEGQMLAAMILAQEKNQDGKPIFGCWVQGQFWYFTTLIGKHYCISHSFDATNPEALLQIVSMLRKLKALILNEKILVF